MPLVSQQQESPKTDTPPPVVDTPSAATEPPKPAEGTTETAATSPDTTVGIDYVMSSMGFSEAATPNPAVQEPPAQQNAPEGQPEPKEEASGETPKEEKKPEESPATEKPAETTETTAEETTEDEEPVIDLEAIQNTVREAIKETRKPDEPAKTSTATAEQPTLSPSRRNTLEAAAFLESNNPEYRGTGLQDQFKRWWNAEDAYKKQWLKENPGKRFREDEEIHNDFYAQAPQPDYAPADLEDAKVQRQEQADQERERRHKEEVGRIQYENQLHKHEREIKESSSRAVADLYVNSPDNVKEALTVDGKLTLNNETLEKLEVEEPVRAERLKHHSTIVGPMIEELEKLTRFPEHYRPDMANPVHKNILQFADSLEQHLLSRPKSETTINGKQFLAQADYMDRRDQIVNSQDSKAQKVAKLQQLESKYYFPDAAVIRHHLVRSAAQRAHQEAEEIEARLAKSKKYSRPQSAAATTQPQNGSQNGSPKSTDSRDVRPPSPTVSSSDRVNASAADPQNIKSKDDYIDRAMGWA